MYPIGFLFVENSIEDVFSTLLETSTNAIETHVLMAKMNLSGLLDTNLYDYVSLLVMYCLLWHNTINVTIQSLPTNVFITVLIRF